MTERPRRPLILPLALIALVATSGLAQASTAADVDPPALTALVADREAAPTAVRAASGLARARRSDVASAPFEAAIPALVSRPALAMVAMGVGTAHHVREQARELAAAAAAEAERRAAAELTAGYSGRNRFWIPSLDMSYRVHLFECTRKREPDDYMYRWGCAGRNNVYILGHASSVMKPLHDLFERGDLEVGMVALYADGDGNVRAYRVTEWRVVDPVDSHWAIAHQDVPSMTLQTCVGKNGVDRLNVRLVAVG
jgi:hypothetical protein